jgi:serine/threonine protein kinase
MDGEITGLYDYRVILFCRFSHTNNLLVISVHQDIKPDNVLLFRTNSDNTYVFNPKLADFGLISTISNPTPGSGESMGHDNHGNQRYSRMQITFSVFNESSS